MEVSFQDLCKLFESFCSSNPAENQEASDRLDELTNFPETIFALFDLLENVTNQNIRRTAYFILATCFRNTKSHLADEIYIKCRQRIIYLLQTEENIQCIEALINIVIILSKFPIPWGEIFEFALSINYLSSVKNLFLVLSIFSGIIDLLPAEHLLQNQEYLMNLTLAAINFDIENRQTICQSVTFLHNIYVLFQKKIPDHVPDSSCFHQRLLQIFVHSIRSFDIEYFIHIISPIINGYENNVFIFQANFAIPEIIQVLQNDQLDVSFRLTVHNFLVISLSKEFYSQILSPEDWQSFYSIEKSVTNLIVSFSDQIDAIMWLDDVLDGIQDFIQRLSYVDAIVIAMNQQSELNPQSSLAEICFSLLLFVNIIDQFQDQITNEQLCLMYSAYLNSLTSHNSLLMNLSACLLDELLKCFEPIIGGQCIIDTLNCVLAFTNECNNNGYLLYAFVKILIDTDSIFNKLMEIGFDMINKGTPLGCFIVSETIDRSSVLAYENFEILYEQFIATIKTPEKFIQLPHCYVLVCLTSLINLCPERIEPLMNDFLVPIFIALQNTKEPILIKYIIRVLDAISKNINLIKILDFQFYKIMVDTFPKLIKKDWRSKFQNSLVDIKFQKTYKKFLNALKALEVLTKFTIEFKQPKIECAILSFLPLLFDALDLVYESPNENILHIFDSLIFIISNLDFIERSAEMKELEDLRKSIQNDNSDAKLIELFNMKSAQMQIFIQEFEMCKFLYQIIIKLLEKSEEETFSSNLIIVIKSFIAIRCIDVNQYGEIINLIINVIMKLNNSPICISQFGHLINVIIKQVNIGLVFPVIIPFIKEILSDASNTSLIVSGLEFIKNLEEFTFVFLQNPEMSDLWSSIPNLIKDSSSNRAVTSAVLKMMSVVCQKSERDLILPISTSLLQVTQNRLRAEVSNPSKLRDDLTALLAVLGGSVIGDLFPFEEVIPLILQALPLEFEFAFCSDAYQFISGICCRIILNNEDMKNLYITMLIKLFTLPYKIIKFMNIDIFVQRALIHSLAATLNLNEDNEQFLPTMKNILRNNPLKYQSFVHTFNKICYLSDSEWNYCNYNNSV